MKNILVYNGEGVDKSSYQALFDALAQLPHYSIYSANPHFLRTTGWEKQAALVVFPGGRDEPYHFHLQGEGNRRIREYVHNGGRYLGICAGGYYGSSHIEFDKEGDLEVCGSRELAFFQGKAIGPAYKKGLFRYENSEGACSAPIAWEGGISHIYFNGGCFFEDPESYETIEVIGRYHDLPDCPAAVIYCRYGQGAALLTGIHPEYKPSNPFFKHIINKILT